MTRRRGYLLQRAAMLAPAAATVCVAAHAQAQDARTTSPTQSASTPGVSAASPTQNSQTASPTGDVQTVAPAQDAPTASATPDADVEQPSGAPLGDIVVTANKRSSLLSRTPIAVTALDAGSLTTRGVVELRNLNSAAPNVRIKTVGLANSIQVTVRGITNNNFNTGGQPAVATYVDGVLVPRTQGLNGALYDIERVEILRGPQGTLYGRNATAGNINILTASPQRGFGASASLSYGNYNDVQATAMINLPVSDTLAVRIAGSFHRSDGFFETAKNNPRGEDGRNYGAADDYAGRLTALWTPSERFSWRLSAEQLSANGTPGLDFDTGPDGRPLDRRHPFENPIVAGVVEPNRSIRSFTLRSRMNYEFDEGVSLSWTAGYQNLRHSAQTEVAGEGNVPTSFIDTIRAARNRSHYQELNLTYDRGRFFNVLGANYTYEQEGTINPGHYGPAGNQVTIAFGTGFRTDYKNNAWGVFDQLTFRATDSFRVTGGVRYSHERARVFGFARNYTCSASFTYAQAVAASLSDVVPPGCAGNSSLPNAGSWSQVTWRGGLEYDVAPASMAYVTVSTGFKSGGLNGLLPGLPPSFAPEKTTNYEAGLKARLFDGVVRLNSALFYTVYEDLQVVQFLGSPVARQTTTNAGRAEIYGLELEADFQLSPNDVLSTFGNYLHARYDRYDNAVNPFPTVSVVPSLAGNSLPNAPDWSARAEYKHTFDLSSGGSIVPSASVYWQSRTYLREFNLPIDRVGAYALLSGNITYADPGERWTLQVFVQNATNKVVRNGASIVGRYFSAYDPPRTYGARASFKF